MPHVWNAVALTAVAPEIKTGPAKKPKRRSGRQVQGYLHSVLLKTSRLASLPVSTKSP
ncbi:hypothetical protein C7449_104161 [Mycoplana dimorpha]|uniref:Uncharacterized protein n=1 Tax=Mycoplana dimorpha TaxID=28320 RepID=A0A2T5B810_MYCDI|nr:hypothetical protein C7449_104161 [Mycoplana dimorpha]